MKDWLKKLNKELDKYFPIEDKMARGILLLLAAICGVLLWAFLHNIVRCLFGSGEHVTGWMEIFLLSGLVLLALWWFRTYDTRQQIDKAQEQINKSQELIDTSQKQIQQGNFVSGLNKLLKTDTFSISVGVQMLIQVSRNTRSFDEDIRLAFIKRIQIAPKPTEMYIKEDNSCSILNPRLNYLPHIFNFIVNLAEKNGKDINTECFDVPEMTFKITEFLSTHKFRSNLELDSKNELIRQIPLAEIKEKLIFHKLRTY